MSEGTDRPLTWIGRADYGLLLRAVDLLAAQAPDVSAFLSRKLDRAIVRPEGELPRTLVRMGSRVLFRRADDMPPEWGELVYPTPNPVDGQITVASPLGAAMLGLREGERVPYVDADGTARRLSVERVLRA